MPSPPPPPPKSLISLRCWYSLGFSFVGTFFVAAYTLTDFAFLIEHGPVLPAFGNVSQKSIVVNEATIETATTTTNQWPNLLEQRENATQCLVKLQQDLTPLFQQLKKQQAPVLTSVKVTKKSTLQLNFNLRKAKKEWLKGGAFMCYDTKADAMATEASPAVVGTTASTWTRDSKKDMLIMECPTSTKYVVSRYPEIAPITYDLTGYLECEEYSKFLFPQSMSSSSASNHTLMSVCTMVDFGNTNLIPQWVEYYKLIGFDHIWLYWNSPWDKIPQSFQQYLQHPEVLSYATLIPFVWDGAKDFYYQASQTTDCLTVARNANYEWVFLADVDEYLQVLPEQGQESSLREMIAPYESQPISSLQIKNWFFGLQERDMQKWKGDEFLIGEFQYREEGPVRNKVKKHPDQVSRAKSLVRPERVIHFHVHWVTNAVPGNKTIYPSEWTFRHCHFKYAHYHSHHVYDPTLANAWVKPLAHRLTQLGWGVTNVTKYL